MLRHESLHFKDYLNAVVITTSETQKVTLGEEKCYQCSWCHL